MTTPTIITQRYLILPETAQAVALDCQHEWRELQEGDDEGEFWLIADHGNPIRKSEVRPCRNCVAALLIVTMEDSATYSTAILRDAPERGN
jgi:hypothetical protein